ncbi:NUDIX hydrolase (plasmid) [Streptomyces sp. DSM 116496]|uniref:NUDIX hydrolase n=1 Tax=Streptomyces stoeckheimensis TaxID=3344656 RepID=UPI0038B37B7D
MAGRGCCSCGRAAGDVIPGLWDLPSGVVAEAESPEQTALRALGSEAGIHGIGLTDYAGSFDYSFDGTITRQLVFCARADTIGIDLSAVYDAYTWRYADALPAVSRDVLDLIQRIAPPKPQLDPEEWHLSWQRSGGSTPQLRDPLGAAPEAARAAPRGAPCRGIG